MTILLYSAIGLLLGTYVFYRGVLTRPRVKFFTAADRVTLTLTAFAIGAGWILFVPALCILGLRQATRHFARRSTGWGWPSTPHASVRS